MTLNLAANYGALNYLSINNTPIIAALYYYVNAILLVLVATVAPILVVPSAELCVPSFQSVKYFISGVLFIAISVIISDSLPSLLII